MKEIFIERREDVLRIAVKKENNLIDCFIEEEEREPYPGQIYKGVVKSILPSIKSAFIDLGLEKNAYLFLEGKYEKKGIKKGDEIIVEVVKEELEDKGAKVTTAFTIPGRYIVLLTDNKGISFSSKITSEEAKKKIQNDLVKPEEVGIKIRTNAVSVSAQDINEEIQELYSIYKRVISESSYRIKPGLLYGGGGVLSRVLRDSVDEETGRITVDNQRDQESVTDFFKGKKDIAAEVRLYQGYRSLFDVQGIERELLHNREKRVNLLCGGHIFIEKTEAMYVIDVNSGKNSTSSNREATALATNLEAAKYCASQIRLRNLSGIIVIDFIDMGENKNKNKVMEVLKKGFEDDKNKTVIYPFTELSLVQIARRRRGKTLSEFMEEDCDKCNGSGKKLKLAYLYLLLKNEILKADNESKIRDIYIELNTYYKEKVTGNLEQFIHSINGEDKKIYLSFSAETESFKVESLIFDSQVEKVQKYKVYG